MKRKTGTVDFAIPRHGNLIKKEAGIILNYKDRTVGKYGMLNVQNKSGTIIIPGADTFLARPGRKQARKHVRDARDFNNIEKRAVIKFLFLQGKALKEIHAILTGTVACFLPGRAKDLSAPL